MLATGGEDCVIRLWDVSYIKEEVKLTKNHEFHQHTASINGLDFHVLGELVQKFMKKTIKLSFFSVSKRFRG